ncbi:MAG: hypothetical protein EOO69_05175 [Moraxellaceae bacterium]|nr:MAG: hypothetical protein EOO69_05175 [Moraxellaceae bacterium]
MEFERNLLPMRNQILLQLMKTTSLAGFLILLVLNVLTYFYLPYLSKLLGCVYILFFLIFIIYPPMVLKLYKKKPTTIYEERNISPIDILNQLPVWLGLLAITIVIYTFFNFMSCLGLLEGSAKISDGKFAIEKRGGILYYVSYEYYIQHRLYELRLWSGNLLIFYLICSIYYWFFSPVDNAEQL